MLGRLVCALDALSHTLCFAHIYSQFFVCTADTPWLDGKHVVFGKVTSGIEVIDKIEGVGSQSGRTAQKVVVKDCGEL